MARLDGVFASAHRGAYLDDSGCRKISLVDIDKISLVDIDKTLCIVMVHLPKRFVWGDGGLMSNSQQTEQTRRVVRAIHAASAKGDLEKERQLFSPDLVIEEPPYLPYGGTFHGYDGFLQLAQQAIQFVDFSSLVLESLTVEGNLGFAVVRVRLFSGTEIIATEQWRVENGLAVHCRISWFDATPAQEMRDPPPPAGAAPVSTAAIRS
jgi:quinol monooxygenase YgiN